MLSSTKKSVPTIKQFVQPYFIEIGATGVIAAACHRFDALLKQRNLHNYLGINPIDIFHQLGSLNPVIDHKGSVADLPQVFDLRLGNVHRPFIIRWTKTPCRQAEDGKEGFQLTGMKIY